jgi:cytochrome c biogenesis protein CcdA/thiol-disulfide isomerase/thioredoxin
MLLLIVFAFVAGAATAVSPCVLPVLPVVLAGGMTRGRRRPLGIVTGLALSFTFATVALVYVIDALGLPDDFLRRFAIVVLLVFGISLLVPPLSARVEAWLSRLTARAPVRSTDADGFWTGMLLGASLGLVYAPCAGPILAGVITVSASQEFTVDRLAIALAYGIGTAVVLYVLMLGGRRLTARLGPSTPRFQAAIGVVMVAVAVAMLANLDTRFETAIAAHAPTFLTNPTHALETTGAAERQLAKVRVRAHRNAGTLGATHPSSGLRDLGAAPEFVDNQRWFNTPDDRPLTLEGLRGRVVLVDFWTYSCINCLRTLPYLKAWDAKYRRDGLTIVGVHSPEFPFEKDTSNVGAAIRTNGIRYPVAQDNDLATWDAWGNQYWPAEYFVDARGHVRFVHFGEGEYGRKEQVIRALLEEAGRTRLGTMTRTRAVAPSNAELTPESYLGALRAARFDNGTIHPGVQRFGAPATPRPDHLAYSGTWEVTNEHATAGADAGLALHFRARRVYLVLGAPEGARSVRLALDGRPVAAAIAGTDVRDGAVRVIGERLYELIDLPRVGDHVLSLRPDAGVQGYAFTFG